MPTMSTRADSCAPVSENYLDQTPYISNPNAIVVRNTKMAVWTNALMLFTVFFLRIPVGLTITRLGKN
jgi:hypothetical protein